MKFKSLFKQRNNYGPKVRIEKAKNKYNSSRSLILEFIGPSGVGKTTLYNLIKNNLSAHWNSTQLLKDHPLDSIENQLIKAHWEIFKSKIRNVDSLATDDIEKINLAGYHREIIVENLKLLSFQGESGFVLEEGVCHNFSSEVLELKDEDFLKLLKNRSFIFVFARNPSTIVNQIRQRQKEKGHLVFHHRGLDDVSLLKLTLKSLRAHTLLKDKLKRFNFPICELYAEDSIEFNCNKIVEFEELLYNGLKDL